LKVVKPQRLGILHHLHERGGRPRLAVAVLVLFPFERPERLLPEIALWKLVAENLGAHPFDEGMDKACGEVLVHGSCFTPGGRSLGVCAARVAIGSVDKTVVCVGDRTWRGGVPTEPAPFTEMPMGWDRAFGGEGFARNPAGRGFVGRGVDGVPLANLERAGHLVTSPGATPEPAGFGPIDRALPQRHALLGTYDARWLETRFPGYADDLDPRALQVAPPDQWIEGFFAPASPFVVEHMHPDRPKQEGRLPDVRARAFVRRRRGETLAFEEIPTHIDTVHLFPADGRGIAVHRGVVFPDEDDASDLLQLLVAADRANEPRPPSHYESILKTRLEPANPAELLRESGLVPPDVPGDPFPEERTETQGLMAREKLLRKNQRRGAQKRIDATRADLESRGMDTSALRDLDPPAPPVAREDLARFVETERERARVEREKSVAKREEALARARSLCAEHGLDVDALGGGTKAEKKTMGGPPAFTASGVWERMREAKRVAEEHGAKVPEIDAKLADPELGVKLQQAERKLRDAYRLSAHLQPASPPLDEATSLARRDDLVLRVTAGIPVEDRDFTGADLSGLVLRGADLAGGFFEGADLRGADLTGAKLDRAVLARAKLDGALLDGASLRSANLGEASLAHAKASGADFAGAELAKADLTGATLATATLTGAKMRGAKLTDLDATRVRAPGLLLQGADLGGACFAGADLAKGIFLRCSFERADLSAATLTSATFLAGSGKQAILRGALLGNVRLVKAPVFAGADFTGADLAGANLREAHLEGADFTGASLEGADLSGAHLEGAKLARVEGSRARFSRSDLRRADVHEARLLEAHLDHAEVGGATFARANLFRADLARMNGDVHTSFDGAHLARVRVVPPRKRDGGSR
jgi:uncharacterized protein YjbI with pentapeptide repeats